MHHSCALTIFRLVILPKTMIQPLKIQALSVNLTLKNVGVISGWSAGDPENSDANTPRTLLFGLNMTL